MRFLHAAEASYESWRQCRNSVNGRSSGTEKLADLRAWQVRGFENYVIFYRPIEHGIEIVRVLHAARDIAAIFEDET